MVSPFTCGLVGMKVFSFSVPVPPFLEPSYQPLHNSPGAKRCLSDKFSASVCVHIDICIGKPRQPEVLPYCKDQDLFLRAKCGQCAAGLWTVMWDWFDWTSEELRRTLNVSELISARIRQHNTGECWAELFRYVLLHSCMSSMLFAL